MSEYIYRLRVHIEDTDCSGIVYHPNFLNFFERARSEWAEAVGYGIVWQRQNGILFPVRYAKVDFVRPVTVHQQVEVVTRIQQIRFASIIYDQHLRLADTTDTILCRAEIKIACVDRNLRPCGLPQSLIQLLGEEA